MKYLLLLLLLPGCSAPAYKTVGYIDAGHSYHITNGIKDYE